MVQNIKAKTPTVQYIDNVYANKISSEQVLTGQLGYIYMGGQIAFCIDPFKIIGNSYEINNTKINEYYTKEEQRKIQLIIHYGSGTHLNNKHYYMATQELIWRIKGEGEYFFTTTPDIDGEKIDIEVYKNDIMKNVEKYELLPSFSDITLTPKLYDKIELIDENEVLKNYDILNLSNNIVTRINNGINIQVTDKNASDITLSYLARSGAHNNTYVGNGQTLITSSLEEQKTTYIHLKPVGVSYYLKIKFLEDNRSIFGKVKFKIYNHNTSQYIDNGRIFESDSFGVFNSDFKLDLGTYEIAYIDIPRGYISPSFSNQFTLEENTPVNSDSKYEFISYLDTPRGKLTINRNAILYDGSIKKLDEIEYKIYASSNIYDAHSKLLYNANQLVDIVKTNNGKAEIILPMGKYYIEEQANQYDLPISSNKYISFIYNDSITEMYYKNVDITTSLPMITFNIKTLKENIDGSYNGYSNFQYELYAKEDVIYLNEVVFKKGNLIKSFTSNNDGYIYENLSLPYGEYEIKEINIDNDYYENENISYNFTNQNNYLDLNVEKKLKRGNLKIKIYSETANISNDIYFIYDREYKYNIDNELSIDNIKIGDYRVIYDKEYFITIYQNKTTLLEIEIKKEIADDINKDETDGEKDNADDKENNEEKDNDNSINEDNNQTSDNKPEENDNKNNSSENENKDETNEEKDNTEDKENNEGKDNDNSINEDNNQTSDNELEENYDKNENVLPNTYNYFKKYYNLFFILLITGISFKLHENKS